MKHGPIALIEPGFYSLFLCLRGDRETRQAISEVKARGGNIFVIGDCQGEPGVEIQLEGVTGLVAVAFF